MEIFKGASKYPKEWSLSFTGIDKYAPLAGDFVYIENRINFKALESLKGRKIVYADWEEPNRYFVSDPAFRREEYEYEFYKILSPCPYTTEWLNKKQGKNRRTFVFSPYDESLAPPKTEKIYDIMYCGSIFGKWLLEDVKTITKFNYRFVAQSGVIPYKILPTLPIVARIRRRFPKRKILEGVARYITNRNVSHLEKFRIMSQTRIFLTHNLLMCPALNLQNIYKTDGWEENEAFKLLPRPSRFGKVINYINYLRGKTYLVPQMKGRAFEAALCRSLILCRKDPFNIIEMFFEPNKEFVYYEHGKLEEKIKEILSNFKAYEPIIENAYKRVTTEYTTKRFFEKYLKDIK